MIYLRTSAELFSTALHDRCSVRHVRFEKIRKKKQQRIIANAYTFHNKFIKEPISIIFVRVLNSNHTATVLFRNSFFFFNFN